MKESPGLGAGGALSIASLLSTALPADFGAKEGMKVGMTLLREGIPPIATRLVERIRSWSYVDLAEILTDIGGKAEDSTTQAIEGQIILVQSWDQARRKRKKITDIASWAQAFAIYVAALATAEATTKEEVASLLAHQNVILQIQKDLGGSKWLQYDHHYREWAAATNKRLWGEMNLTIYGRCLCAPSSLVPPPSGSPLTPMQGKRGERKPKGKNKACFKHNFEVSCRRTEEECHYDHVCWHCGAVDHIAGECPRGPKRFKKN